jgi:hypothetical protein
MKYIIHGRTLSGHVFRPSDWAERLCSVLACFQPNPNKDRHRQNIVVYSQYVVPTSINNVRAVVLDTQIGDIEPLALAFVLNFASDNQLVIEPQSD